MEAKNLNQQLLAVSKAAFDTSFATFLLLQEQLDRGAQLFWGQVLSLSEEGKKSLTEWQRAFRNTWNTWKKAMDEGFRSLESLAS